MLRIPNETMVEIAAYLRRFDLDVVELTSKQVRQALSALSAKPLRRLDVVSLTDNAVIIKANGLRHSFGMEELRVSFGGLLRLTKDLIFNELRIQFVTRVSDVQMALRAFLPGHLTLTLRVSYADVSGCDSDGIVQIARAVVSGGSVFIEKPQKPVSSATLTLGSATELDMTGFETYRTTRPTFLESVAAYDFKSLGLKLTFLRDSTGLQVSYRKVEK